MVTLIRGPTSPLVNARDEGSGLRHAICSPIVQLNGFHSGKSIISGLRAVDSVFSVVPDLSANSSRSARTREGMSVLRHVILVSGTASDRDGPFAGRYQSRISHLSK